MSIALQQRGLAAEVAREETAMGRESFRIRWTKIVAGLILGVCFWYSVPYYLPLKVDPDPMKAAANEAHAYEGNVSRQIAMPIILCVALYLLWRLPKRGKFGGHFLYLPLLYCAWAMVSFAWSEDPSISMKRLVVFAIDAFFAYAVARLFSMMEIALMGFFTFSAVALLSFYVDFFQQKIFAPFDPDYRFTGVMTANYQAMNLLAAMICAVTLAQRRPKWLRFIAPVVAVELVLLYLTRARLSAALCVLILAVLVARWVRSRWQPAMQAMALIAALALLAPAMVLYVGRGGGQNALMMGRTDTENNSNLSNRAPLWGELMESVSTRPWQGFGYEAFWTPARVERVSADQGWMVPNAHDSYLDQVLSLGYVGAALYACMVWGAVFIAWARFRRRPSEVTMLPAALLTWLALTGLAESVPLDPYLPTMLAYACIVKMCLVEGSEPADDSPDLIEGFRVEATA